MPQSETEKKRKIRPLAIVLRIAMMLTILAIVIPIVMCAQLTGNMQTTIPEKIGHFHGTEQDFAVRTTDGLTIRGWYVPGREGRAVVVLCHGVGANRLQMITQAQFLNSYGHPVVLFDFRNHGESDVSRTTYGYWEQHDIAAVVAWLVKKQPQATIVLWGLSMGASTALIAAPRLPAVDAVIAESPFDTLTDTFKHHNKLYVHLPNWPIVPLTLAFMGMAGGFEPEDVSPLAAVSDYPKPILFVTSPDDKRMPPEVIVRIAKAHQGPNRVLKGKGSHALIFAETGHRYRNAVRRFLQETTP